MSFVNHWGIVMTIEELMELPLHSTDFVNSRTMIMRVQSGWIYRFKKENSNEWDSVFVPIYTPYLPLDSQSGNEIFLGKW